MTATYDREQRQREILDAALACFLSQGYARTSMADIAGRARLSRSLLYLQFPSKEELFGALVERLLDESFERAMKVLGGRGSRRERLLNVIGAWELELYGRVVSSPHGEELFAEAYRIRPRLESTHKRRAAELVSGILEDEARREVFLLSLKGLQADRPTAEALRRRVEVLVDRFV